MIAGANSLDNFRRIRDKAQKYPLVRAIAYWPLLALSEGYWISPWSDERGLERIFTEIESRKEKSPLGVMLDLEPPFWLVGGRTRTLTGLTRFSQKKTRIKKFLKDAPQNNLELITAEWPRFLGSETLQRAIGIAFDPTKYPHKKGKMVYTSSMQLFGIPLPVALRLLKREAEIQARGGYGIGLGCIAPAGDPANLNDPVLTPNQLKEEMEIVRDVGIKDLYIYSLRGVNRDFSKVLAEYSNH